MIAAAAAAFLLAGSAVAQFANCPSPTGDFVVVKDVAAGATAVNSGGLVGGEHVNFTFAGANGVTVTPRGDGSSPGSLYWFFKFDIQECYDASGYNAIEFDVTMPAGSTFSMTWTTHLGNCSAVTPSCAGTNRCVRGPDSKYIPITDYIVPSGSKQSVRIPFADFLPNTDGTGLTDFYHIKDFTFIGFSPNTTATNFIFNNILLKAGCTAGLPAPPSDRPGVATKPANSSTDVSPLPGMIPRTTAAPRASGTAGPASSSTAKASTSTSSGAVPGSKFFVSSTFVAGITSAVAVLFAGAVFALA
ncbi:hypothetical protein BJ742DRAFT_742304 [Cladochytrium replicatum]|nr:hypothetical protein BJ742DRAFT_742304 [Cladochytrium replicatum]